MHVGDSICISTHEFEIVDESQMGVVEEKCKKTAGDLEKDESSLDSEPKESPDAQIASAEPNSKLFPFIRLTKKYPGGSCKDVDVWKCGKKTELMCQHIWSTFGVNFAQMTNKNWQRLRSASFNFFVFFY